MTIKEKVLKEFKVDINTWNYKLIGNVIDLTLVEFGKILIDNYKKCFDCYNVVEKEQMKQDFHQRLDEIALIYSDIFNVSVNKAHEELNKKGGKK